MNVHTGQIMSEEAVKRLSQEEQKAWVPVVRDLTSKEASDAQIRMYSLCGCGSGKKFKFCCHKRP